MKYAQAGGTQNSGARTDPAASGGLGGLLGGLLGDGAASPTTGGLGGLLGGLLGGGAGGGLGGLLAGLGGLLSTMRGQGLGQQVDSWMAPGPNQAISLQELEASFDPQELDQAAQHAGTDRASLLAELSTMLPELVDRATPHGGMPQHEGELGQGGLAELLGGLAGRTTPQR